MDDIVSTAIVGTGQLSNPELTTGTPIDTLVSQLGEGDIERKLLLAAGSLAIYQQTGRIPEEAPEPLQPAASESIPACSTKEEHLLQGLFQGGQRELLPEALQRLKQAGQRLPYELLPLALGYGAQSKEIRPALFAVLGERGRWLSQFEKTWAWVAQFLAETTKTLPADAETLWQEGTPGQRRELLARLRSIEPAKAREWLSDVWKKEKAEARTEFLATFITGLSPDDEPFLENALDDRSEGVREISAVLLARIPASALAQRMLARADALLTYTNGEFSITLPTEIDASWQRDGIPEPPRQSDSQTWYTRLILSLVPPTHWEERFSLAPVEISAKLSNATHVEQANVPHEASESAAVTVEGKNALGALLIGCWSYAATLFESPHWVEPLWAWWCKNPYPYTIRGASTADIYQTLGKSLPQDVAEKYAQAQLALDQSEQWTQLLATLPTPWSKEFGDMCLEALRKYVLALDGQSYPTGHWQIALTTLALALPFTCFEAAQAAWEFPDSKTWQIQQWKNQMKTFTALVRKRQQIIKEI